MGRYRKVDTRIWNDAKFRSMTDHGKLVFLFVLTHPHMTSLGAMRASLDGLASELGWTPKAFREAFAEACFRDMIQHDETASFIAFPNFLKFNPPESANVVKSWRDQWDNIPECESKSQLYHRVKAFLEAFDKGFLEAYLSRISSPEDILPLIPSTNTSTNTNTKERPKTANPRFSPPTISEVAAYCQERKNGIDPEAFITYYATRGWIPGNSNQQMKNWKAAVITWEKKDKERKQITQPLLNRVAEIEEGAVYCAETGSYVVPLETKIKQESKNGKP